MMLKCFLCVVFVVLPVKCLFQGEKCKVDEQPGTCKLLTKCTPLLNEIKGAGTPMPAYMRDKLQRLGCGFEYDKPMVCCNSRGSNNNQDIWPNSGSSSQNENGNERPYTNSQNNQNSWSTSRPNKDWGFENPDPYSKGSSNFGDNNGSDTGTENGSRERIPDVRNHPNIGLLPINCGIIEGDRILGGNRTKLYEMPWMVLLSYDSGRGTKLSCGGTLINEWYVLTAAHCLSFLGSKLTLRSVILGEYDIRKDPDCERIEGELSCAPNVRNVAIDTVTPHPQYTPQRLADDIGLIRLREPADFGLDSMKPICLPISSELQTEKLDGLKGVVAGWGVTEEGIQSPVLLSVDLPIITNQECQDIYNGLPRIADTQLCAGGVLDKDSCGGDSGGPLLYPGRTRAVGVRYVQRGIVSYGSKRCGIGGYPGVYTRVAYYMDWILDNMR